MTLYFASFTAFLDMNGYAIYVWPAWGVVIGLLVIQWLMSMQERKKIVMDIRRRERRELAQRQANESDVSSR